MNEKNTDQLLKLIDDLIKLVGKNVDNINRLATEIAELKKSRLHEAKRTGCDRAWYKDCKYNYNNNPTYPRLNSHYTHYFVNDLLGQRIPITEQQYQDDNFTSPTN